MSHLIQTATVSATGSSRSSKSLRQQRESPRASVDSVSVDAVSQHPSSSSRLSISRHAGSSTAHSHPAGNEASDWDFVAARRKYLTILVGGILAVTIIIFSILPIYWGSLWKTPAHPLDGWIVDFDGGSIGAAVVQSLTSPSSNAQMIKWEVISASRFPQGIRQLEEAVLDEKSWVAIAINAGASARLSAALSAPDAAYDGSAAITVLGVEARNENAFRNIIRPTVQTSLGSISQIYNTHAAQKLASAANVLALLSISPQILVEPVSYTIQNLAPFDQPVASAITFIGILFQLMLSFFIVLTGNAARQMSKFEKHHSFSALIKLRFLSSFGAFFTISFFYSLLSLAFQVDFTRRFGHAGFVIFWMINFLGMSALGLALEAMITLLTPTFIPFFMLLWMISNASTAIYPLETMPRIFHYGHAAPFYNISHAIRTVVFGTRNEVGLNLGVLIAWIAISCVSLLVIQYWRWRQSHRIAKEVDVDSK